MDKRGMSPLIATLLLIAFAVALGVVIMNFGSAQVEMEAQCSVNVGLKFSKISGVEQFCLDKSTHQLKFTLENGVNIKVEGLVVNIIGTKQALTHPLKVKIDKAGIYLGTVPYDESKTGKLRQIKIVPKINMYEEELVCQEKAIVLESVKDC